MIARRRPRRPSTTAHRPEEVERGERGVWVAAAAISAGLVWWYAALFLFPIDGAVITHPAPAAVLEARPPSPAGETLPNPLGPVLGPRIDEALRTDDVGRVEPAGAVVDVAAVGGVSEQQRAQLAVRVALQQIGLPYVWGGNGPENGHRGFDCSGLTTFAYAKAGVALPRTAHTQFRHGPRVPAGTELLPGDLVFYGTYAKVHHVGMYIGQGRMVNAPTFGQPVQTAWFRWGGDDYIGATRPATIETGAVSLPDPAVPELPDPRIPDQPIFRAPPAPPLPVPTPPLALSNASTGLVSAPTPATETGTVSAAPTTPTAGAKSSLQSPLPSATTAPVTPTHSPAPAPTTGMTSPVSPGTSASPVPAPDDAAPSTAPPAPVWGTGHPPIALVDSGSVIGLAAVDRGSDGLPAQPGAWTSDQRILVRLTHPLSTTSTGGELVLRFADGTSVPVSITSTQTLTTADAATGTAPLTVVTPAGEGHWHVTTGTPGKQPSPTTRITDGD